MKKFWITCFNPKQMMNPYTKKWFVSGCGSCPACIGIRHMKYVSMMQSEKEVYRYAFFCTLTYSDKYIPKLRWSKDGRSLIDRERGLFIPDARRFCTEVDAHWFNKKSYFEYLDITDFQKFMKRLRQNYVRNVPLNELEIDHYKTIYKDGKFQEKPVFKTLRFFQAGELGPETVRPHFHCIVYFNSKWFAEHFEQMFHKSWSVYNRSTRSRDSLGIRSECRPCNIAEDAYTAAYCDSFTDIPELYRCKEIRPKHSYSTKPSLGCSRWDAEACAQKIHSGGLRDFCGLDKQGEPIIVPCPKSIENTLFPKCPSFDSQSDGSRIQSYGVYRLACSEFGGEMIDYINFAFWCNQNNRKLCRAIPALAPYLDRQYYQVPLIPNRKYVKRPYYALYLSGRRFIENCAKYGFSPESYVQVIKDYYSLKDYYRLTDFYKFLEHVQQNESILPFYTLHTGVSKRFQERYPFKESLNYRDMVSLFTKMHADRQKSKKERDYQHKGNAVVYNPNNSFIYG